MTDRNRELIPARWNLVKEIALVILSDTEQIGLKLLSDVYCRFSKSLLVGQFTNDSDRD